MGFSSCGARALLLCGMWDLPRPGLEPMSPALAGRCLTTAPPGKPSASSLDSPPGTDCKPLNREGTLTLAAWVCFYVVLEDEQP